MASSSTTPSTLVVFDFDWSLINCNSDTWIVQELGDEQLMRSLRATLGWTQLMDRMMLDIMGRGGRSWAEVEQCLQRIPLDSAMTRCIKSLAAAGCELHIISDANTSFIEVVLDNFQLKRYFHNKVHTNPARLDEHGVLRVSPYHSHACPRCPPNMCKGLILDAIRSSSSADQVAVYVGDGRGDICPALRLQACDHLLARQGFPLAQHFEQKPGDLRAELHVWSSPVEIEAFFRNKFT